VAARVALLLVAVLGGCSANPPHATIGDCNDKHIPEKVDSNDPHTQLAHAAIGFYDKTGMWPSTMDEVEQGAAIRGIQLNEILYRNPRFTTVNGDRSTGNFSASWTWPDGSCGEVGAGVINNDFSRLSSRVPQ